MYAQTATLPENNARLIDPGQILPNTASRKFSFHAHSNFRGQIIDGNRPVVFESLKEYDVATVLIADRRVTLVEAQPKAIKFISWAGRATRHTFDYRVTLSDGRRIAIMVKPENRAQRPEFQALVADLTAALPSEFADGIIVVTEKDIHPAQVADARLILAARSVFDPFADAKLHELIRALFDVITVGNLRDMLGLGGRGFTAIIRAIDDGRLQIADRKGWRPLHPWRYKNDGRIDSFTTVKTPVLS